MNLPNKLEITLIKEECEVGRSKTFEKENDFHQNLDFIKLSPCKMFSNNISKLNILKFLFQSNYYQWKKYI